MKTLEKVDWLLDRIEALTEEVVLLQQACPHKNVKYRYGMFGEDEPYVTIKCKDCLKSMHIDKDEDYTNYYLKGIIGSESKEAFKI